MIEPLAPQQMQKLAADPDTAKHLVRARTRQVWRDFNNGNLEGDDLRLSVITVWREAVTPLSWLPPDQWRQLFAVCGYTIDGRPAERPTEPIRLYRGVAQCRLSRRMVRKHTNDAITDPAAAWSWTGSLVIARRFARARARGPLAGSDAVYTIEAPPSALLAGLILDDEYLVDTAQLDHQPERIE